MDACSIAARMPNRQADKFIEAVMLAEFDIDKGSVCRVQYPREVGDAGVLAELMLPEGAHNHFQDWTVFMLNRPTGGGSSSGDLDGVFDSQQKWSVHAYRYHEEGDDPGWVLIEGGHGSDGSGWTGGDREWYSGWHGSDGG